MPNPINTQPEQNHIESIMDDQPAAPQKVDTEW